MLVQVLGPVMVTDSGAAVPLPGSIPARILALLTTNLPTGLRSEALIDGVWGEAATEAASATLQSHVARLRRAIGADRVVTTAYGYRLALPPAAVDAHQFVTRAGRGAALLADGRPVEAAPVLREALELWRGEAYEGIEDCPLLIGERTRLARLRLDTLLQRIDADLSAQCSHELVAEIEALLDDNATNERLWALLMRAWHAVGDTAAALAAFGRARNLLLEQLGVEPGAALRAVQAELLRDEVEQGAEGLIRRGE